MNYIISNFITNYAKDMKHCDRSFLDHLINTYNILKKLNQKEDVCLAGLFHSVYGTEEFKIKNMLLPTRAEIQNIIGIYSESLVYSFSIQKNKDEEFLKNFNENCLQKDIDLFFISYANLKEMKNTIDKKLLNEVFVSKELESLNFIINEYEEKIFLYNNNFLNNNINLFF